MDTPMPAQAMDTLTPTQAIDTLTPAGRRILDAASELFYTRGIHAVGVETIAETAGVTKKTLYDRFGSKEALVATYLAARSARWREWLSRYLDEAAPADRPLAAFDALEDWLTSVPRRGCGFVNAAAELPAHDDAGRRVADAEKAGMRALFTRLVIEGGYAKPGATAEALGAQLFMLHEGATIAYTLTSDDNAVATAREAARNLLRGQALAGRRHTPATRSARSNPRDS